jgi:hypothetical protein
MSTPEEEKEQVVAEGEEEKTDEEAAHEDVAPEPVKPGTWRFLIPIFAFIAGFVPHFIAGWFLFPLFLYAEKEQPIDFNHKLHVEEMGECEGCHFYRDDGTFNGVPKLENCLECHEEQLGEHPEEAKLMAEFVEPEKEIPWLVYSRQPQCVFFSHSAHTVMAEIECTVCHGPVEEQTSSRPYQYNRLTLYSRDIWGWNIAGIAKNSWDRMKMDDCANCHEEMTGFQGSCFQCHK